MYLHLVPLLRMSGATPVLQLCLHGMDRGSFNFYSAKSGTKVSLWISFIGHKIILLCLQIYVKYLSI
jgi:hypothetical protein